MTGTWFSSAPLTGTQPLNWVGGVYCPHPELCEMQVAWACYDWAEFWVRLAGFWQPAFAQLPQSVTTILCDMLEEQQRG